MSFEHNNNLFLYLVHGDTYCVFADDLYNYFIKRNFQKHNVETNYRSFSIELKLKEMVGGYIKNIYFIK